MGASQAGGAAGLQQPCSGSRPPAPPQLTLASLLPTTFTPVRLPLWQRQGLPAAARGGAQRGGRALPWRSRVAAQLLHACSWLPGVHSLPAALPDRSCIPSTPPPRWRAGWRAAAAGSRQMLTARLSLWCAALWAAGHAGCRCRGGGPLGARRLVLLRHVAAASACCSALPCPHLPRCPRSCKPTCTAARPTACGSARTGWARTCATASPLPPSCARRTSPGAQRSSGR